LIPKP